MTDTATTTLLISFPDLSRDRMIQQLVEPVFVAGWDARDCGGNRSSTEAWAKFRTELDDDDTVTRQPITVEDAERQIDVICTDYVDNIRRLKASYEAAVQEFAADLDASPDIDKTAVMAVVMDRIKRMMTETQGVVGE